MVSDAIDFPIRKAQETFTIDIYLENGQSGGITAHPSSRTTSWLTLGDWVGEPGLEGSDVTSVDHWYAIRHSFTRRALLIGLQVSDQLH